MCEGCARDEIERGSSSAVFHFFTRDPPYGCKVTWDCKKAGSGWAAPPVAPWLDSAAQSASRQFYGGKDAVYVLPTYCPPDAMTVFARF